MATHNSCATPTAKGITAADVTTMADSAAGVTLSEACSTIGAAQQLTDEEVAELESCESVIGCELRSFFRVALAFATIKEKRLYRATHSTFDGYCRERWGKSARRAHQLSNAVEVIRSLGFDPNAEAPQDGPGHANHGSHVFVPKERHARILAQMPEGERREAWRRALELANGNPPTAGDVQKAVIWVKSIRTEACLPSESPATCVLKQKKPLR